MSITSRLLSWIRGRKTPEPIGGSYPERREFVYLDEVSVLSILASRTGGIASEFTQKHTASLDNEVGASLGVGLGGAKATLGAKRKTGQVEASQVSRRAIIQSNFKELYDIERSKLALYPASADHLPTVDSIRGLGDLLDSPKEPGLLNDSSTLHRGELLEVAVELEADPIFRIGTIITTFCEMMEDNEKLFEGVVTTQVPEIRSVGRLLESLLGGLVPIRGRLVDYAWIRMSGRDVLVNRSLLCQIPTSARPTAYPVFLVGVAQSDLFWKDIRRVLFSQAQYTVFCRLATSGLTDTWSPVKMADVFSGIASDFDEMIRGLGGELMSVFNKGVRSATLAGDDAPSTMLPQDAQRGELLLRDYVESLANYHKRNIEPTVMVSLTRGDFWPVNWLHTVDSYRPVFGEVTKRVDDLLEVETPHDVTYELRRQVLGWSGLEETLVLDGAIANGNVPEPRCEKFLDCEIIAIYW